jgi:hypothetical protein
MASSAVAGEAISASTGPRSLARFSDRVLIEGAARFQPPLDVKIAPDFSPHLLVHARVIDAIAHEGLKLVDSRGEVCGQ